MVGRSVQSVPKPPYARKSKAVPKNRQDGAPPAMLVCQPRASPEEGYNLNRVSGSGNGTGGQRPVRA